LDRRNLSRWIAGARDQHSVAGRGSTSLGSNVLWHRGDLRFDVQKLLFLGSRCIYPKFAKQSMREDQMLTSELEPTNELRFTIGFFLATAGRHNCLRMDVSVSDLLTV
jgi:hypothetical protein